MNASLVGSALRVGGLLAALVVTTVTHAAGIVGLPVVAPVQSCEAVAKTDLTNVVDTAATIASVKRVDSPVGVFCRILGAIKPAINFEVNLPMTGWQQRYLQTGCGGLCGNVHIQVMHAGTCTPALQGGLVIASDDMGHEGGMGNDGFGQDPQKRIDFAYRANHVTALVAKALIAAFYGQAPRYSYFSGCSDGGREALVEAERFPNDFNGIAAGAPAMNFQVQNSFYHAWQYRANTAPDGTHILLANKLPVLHRAVLAACDSLDGLRDGLIADPRACHFDPAVAQCPAGSADTHDCLTAAEVATARKLYAGPTDEAGHHFTIGGPQPGSELAWAGVFVPDSKDAPVMSKMAAASSEYLIFPEVTSAEGNVDAFAFTRQHFSQLATLHPLYDATDPNLNAFLKSGGRLILWHGWSDPHISPINTIAFYHAVGQHLGAPTRDSFVRLFLFPGVYHCDGGDGFSQFDVLTPLMAWVESGTAPDKIVAAQVPERPRGPPPGMMAPPANDPAPLPSLNAKTLRSRPIYPYPSVAKYSGKGSADEAASFVAAPGLIVDPDGYAWEGADFYKPDSLKSYAVKDGKLVVASK
jgi:hypothetical protein